MTTLKTMEDVQAFLADNPDSLILKHSTACPISARAYPEYTSFAENSDVPAAIVLVIESRAASNYLTERSGVEHHSPQVLFFRDGQCCHNVTHYDISADTIEKITRE